MSKVHLIVEDEHGQKTTHSFELSGDLENLNGIDEAVEAFSHQALPQLESTLLLRLKSGP